MPERIAVGELTARRLDEAAAARVCALIAELPPGECWRRVSTEVLAPDHPFALHAFLYRAIYEGWDEAQGPPPAWLPPPGFVETTNVGSLMNELGMTSYPEFQAWSVREREAFWEMMIELLGIRFSKAYDRVGNCENAESPGWLAGAEMNIAESCFQAAADATAVVYQHEGGTLSTMTYGELDALVNRVANGLVERGFRPGDAIACYIPMNPEAVAIYLGIVKAGCAVVSIAESFAPDEAATRFRIGGAKGVFTQDVILRAGKTIPLYAKAVEAGAPTAVVLPVTGSVYGELREGDVDWDTFLSDNDTFAPVLRAPGECTNVLFSSGTTGDPKAIPWTHTTPIKCAADGYIHHDIRQGDVIAWPTSYGWMMGPFLTYASLINQATVALYCGSPATKEFVEFARDAKVTMLGVVPSLVKAWRENDLVRGVDWSAIRCFSSTGECSNAEEYLWLMSTAGYRPVIEYCGGTEIGGGYITGTVVQPASPATFSTPAAGLDFVLLDENGQEAPSGEVFLIGPSVGLSTELLNRDHHETYFEGTPPGPQGQTLRRHGDEIERLGGGYYRAHGRVDDTMNLGGIKVSSAEIERVLARVEGVRETAAIAVRGEEGGPALLVVYTVLEQGVETGTDNLKAAMQHEIKAHLNPLFHVHDVLIVDALPRTASNKVMRRMLRAEYGAGEKT